METTIQAGMIGGSEILIILVIVLIFFGGKKIPELMKGLGKGVKEYKKAVNGLEEDLNGEPEKPSENSSETEK
jgi:sec-independent protein translocase protein TatA